MLDATLKRNFWSDFLETNQPLGGNDLQSCAGGSMSLPATSHPLQWRTQRHCGRVLHTVSNCRPPSAGGCSLSVRIPLPYGPPPPSPRHWHKEWASFQWFSIQKGKRQPQGAALYYFQKEVASVSIIRPIYCHFLLVIFSRTCSHVISLATLLCHVLTLLCRHTRTADSGRCSKLIQSARSPLVGARHVTSASESFLLEILFESPIVSRRRSFCVKIKFSRFWLAGSRHVTSPSN